MTDFGLIELGLAAIAGGSIASLLAWLKMRKQIGSFEQLGQEILAKAEQEARSLRHRETLSLKEQRLDQERAIERKMESERQKLQRQEDRLKRREDHVEQRQQWLQKKLSENESTEKTLENSRAQLKEQAADCAEKSQHLTTQLEQLAALSLEEAREQLFEIASLEITEKCQNLRRQKLHDAEKKANQEAKQIIASAIGRVCVPCVSEATTTTVPLPSDEMKGRVIGREGRNVRAFEQATGVNVLIDDTPGVLVLSGFDPLRKHIAKLVMTQLVSDGRIHTSKIQELVKQKTEEVEASISGLGEDAALRAGVAGLHPEILRHLGLLSFRTSYGQNVLEHSIEVSLLMTLMAAELGLDTTLAKRIGLLHDIGKALPRERELTHALAGRDFLSRYGETPDVANGVGCHHQEIDAKTIEGSLCSAADAISASRPGARIEALEDYITRLRQLEEVAGSFSGVDKAYALQAGREVHVSVQPDKVDGHSLETLAQDLSAHIEKELKFPGRIKIIVVREQRVIKYAVS